MYHVIKPMQCSKCRSQNIVDPVNEHEILFRCLDCGHVSEKPNTITDADKTQWTHINDKPYEEF